MLIGTWNMQGRWSPDHRALLEQQDCDLWLLTEVNDRLENPTFHIYRSASLIAMRRYWSVILTREAVQQLPDPHPASVAVTTGSVTYCASVLPWRSCGSRPPWIGERHADKTTAAIRDLDIALPPGPLVWGGDWNHALSGNEVAGSVGGRAAITAMLAKRNLQVPTSELPHRIDDLLSIDHIAIDQHVQVIRASRFAADGLSDHDGYSIETATVVR